MMKQSITVTPSILLVIIILLTACKDHNSTPTPLTWSQLPAIPNVYREEASSFSIGTNAYFGLGFGNNDGRYNANATYNNDFWEFNSTTNVWRRITDFQGSKRSGATSFSINGRGYIAFGYSTSCPTNGGLCDFMYYDDVWEYNPNTNTWRKVASFNSISGLRYATAFVINNKAYILTISECLEFDPVTYSFRKRAACPIGLFSGAFSLNNKGYVFLGDPDIEQNKRVYEYDPITDIWSRKKDFPGQPRILPTSFSLNGYGYCGGGYRRGSTFQYFKEFWKYNPTTDEWTQIEDYPGVGSVWLQSMVIGGSAIIGSGYGSETNLLRYDNSFWLFQPK
ncbi:Kelch repeat-containing protein [Spirosoma soli]|uniref:Kelch repeat-containing protein n=1 Tax=Spirosoma soli TaxID=1770529 RepID=A0ABW5LWS0_9BACT